MSEVLISRCKECPISFDKLGLCVIASYINDFVEADIVTGPDFSANKMLKREISPADVKGFLPFVAGDILVDLTVPVANLQQRAKMAKEHIDNLSVVDLQQTAACASNKLHGACEDSHPIMKAEYSKFKEE